MMIKIVKLYYKYDYDYDTDNHIQKLLASEDTNWEEVSDEDFQLLIRWIGKKDTKDEKWIIIEQEERIPHTITEMKKLAKREMKKEVEKEKEKLEKEQQRKIVAEKTSKKRKQKQLEKLKKELGEK